MSFGDITIKVFDTIPQDGKSISLSNQRRGTSGLQFIAECIQRFFRHIAGSSDISTIGVFLEEGDTKARIFTRKDINTLLRAAGISDTHSISRAQIRYLIGNIWREAGQEHSISKERIRQLYMSASMHGPHGQLIHSLGQTKKTLIDLGEQIDLTESDLKELCQVSTLYSASPSQPLTPKDLLTKAQESECKKIPHPSKKHGHSTQSIYEINIQFLQKTLRDLGLNEKDLKEKLQKTFLNQKEKENIQSLLVLITPPTPEPQQASKKLPLSPPLISGRHVVHMPSTTPPPPLPPPAHHPLPPPSLTLENIEELSKRLELMPRRKNSLSAEDVNEFLDRLVDLNMTSLKLATLPR